MLPCVHRDPYRARSLPLVSLVLALLLVGFAAREQGLDPARRQQALEFYQDSGLARLEAPRYRDFLAARSDPDAEVQLAQLSLATPARAAEILLADPQFERIVRAGLVLPAEDPALPAWRESRARFETLRALTSASRWSLSRAHADEAWRFLTYALVEPGLLATLVAALALVLVGTFAEGLLGGGRFLLAVLAATAAGGAGGLILDGGAIGGAAPALSGLAAMAALLHGTRPALVSLWPLGMAPVRVPGLIAWLAWVPALAFLWWRAADATPLPLFLGMQVAAFGAGAVAAGMLRPHGPPAGAPPRTQRVPAAATLSRPGTIGRGAGSAAGNAEGRLPALEHEAEEAASRLDTRRAVRIYRELVEREPERVDLLGSYLNAALMGADDEVLQDAALRILWSKARAPSEELRRIFLQLTQPKVLQSLPFDEHLRLARRLVRQREDAAALRVLDDLLQDDHLRELYGRQLADCLLGLFTAYTRHGLHGPAQQISERLLRHFDSPEQLGGVAPTAHPPSTLFTGTSKARTKLTLVPPGEATGRRTRQAR
jgi:membrane associated rhomboid family serine protease